MDNVITNNIRIIGAGIMGTEQWEFIATFREQYPEYADCELQVEQGGNERRKFTIRPVTDLIFSVTYYGQKIEEEEVE